MSLSAITLVGSFVAAGADKYVQYRDGTIFGGDANLQWDKTTKILAVGAGGSITAPAATITAITATTIVSPDVTVSNMTAKSVLFAGAGGAVSQDNALFSWDDGAKTLTLGAACSLITPTATVSTTLSVTGTADFHTGMLYYPVGTGALTATEDYTQWQSTRKIQLFYDGLRERNLSEVGFIPNLWPLGTRADVAFTDGIALTANGGTLCIPFMLSGHMLLTAVSVRNLDTGTARTWGWDLYAESAGNSATLSRVVASNGTENFTPVGSATTRTLAASGAPVYLGPGLYWLAIQNRHATNTFTLGSTTNASALSNTINTCQFLVTANPNGATLDFVTGAWTFNQRMIGAVLRGTVFGTGASY